MSVAHHPARQQGVRWQRGDPVADLVAHDAFSGALQLLGNAWFPPQVKGVDHHADVDGIEALGDVQRLGQRGDHPTVRGVDGVHRLDAEVDAVLVGVRNQPLNSQSGAVSCGFQITIARRQPTGDEDQCRRIQRRSFLDGLAVSHLSRLRLGELRSREEPAPA